ncbi:uncharacterized protein EV420DRAFT_1749069 [Desarmillaria tabescens]|uniref:Uncharacterized protein n=1 Tax=Armillaria tabescens TaxID=1929756 RepID=A0AA39K6S6_ARMTA|nr:uncharacterized protein EV420DRAFT_1749069 [Desarmillaria tabescens]KAK0455616.1 hypothetical protein EV420DRAFT_1749069 [Desarmillaria tabescens]
MDSPSIHWLDIHYMTDYVIKLTDSMNSRIWEEGRQTYRIPGNSKSKSASKTLGFGSDQTLIRLLIILLVFCLDIHTCYRYT